MEQKNKQCKCGSGDACYFDGTSRTFYCGLCVPRGGNFVPNNGNWEHPDEWVEIKDFDGNLYPNSNLTLNYSANGFKKEEV